jgi:Fe(3+) dicitrate transport protein
VFGDRIRRMPGSVQVLGSETLERYKYDDPHATLQLVPGVYVRQEDGLGLRPNIGIRGAISDRSQKVALMEDGVLFGPAPYSAPAAYYFPVMARMRQVQVLKGPSAIQYGPQTLGGALDLITRNPLEGTRGSVDLAAGEYGYGKFHSYFGAGDARNAYLIEGVHLQSDGFKELPNGAETGFYRNEWMFKAKHVFAPSSDLVHRLSLKLTYSDELSNETYLGLTDQDFRNDPLRRYTASGGDRMRWHRTSAVVTHEIEPFFGLTITTSAYRHDLFRIWNKVNHFAGASLFDTLTEPTTPSDEQFRAILTGQADTVTEAEQLYVGPNQREYVSQGIQSRAELNLDKGPVTHRLEAGLRFHYDRIRRRHTEDAFLVNARGLVRADSGTVITALNRADTYALSAHAIDDLRWRNFTFTPGLRLEAIASSFNDRLAGTESNRTLLVPLGGAGVHYALTQDLGLLAGVHRGMSPPPPGGDNSIKPETSINYEAGIRYGTLHRKAELIGYYNDYENLTDVCTLSSGCDDANLDRQFDAGRARIYGIEALGEEELVFGPVRVPLSFNYTLTLTEFLETFESQDPIFGEVEAGDELPYVPRHQGRASIGLEFARFSSYVAGNYVSKMREQSGAGPLDLALATDRQLTIDAGLSYRVLRSLETYAQVRNALNEHYIASRRPYGARPNPPRWIQIGARFEFGQ